MYNENKTKKTYKRIRKLDMKPFISENSEIFEFTRNPITIKKYKDAIKEESNKLRGFYKEPKNQKILHRIYQEILLNLYKNINIPNRVEEIDKILQTEFSKIHQLYESHPNSVSEISLLSEYHDICIILGNEYLSETYEDNISQENLKSLLEKSKKYFSVAKMKLIEKKLQLESEKEKNQNKNLSDEEKINNYKEKLLEQKIIEIDNEIQNLDLKKIIIEIDNKIQKLDKEKEQKEEKIKEKKEKEIIPEYNTSKKLETFNQFLYDNFKNIITISDLEDFLTNSKQLRNNSNNSKEPKNSDTTSQKNKNYKYPDELSPEERIKLITQLGKIKELRAGNNSFIGTVLFSFENTDTIILETFFNPDKTETYGKATYIIPKEHLHLLSKYTRTELLQQKIPGITRIIHSKSYNEKLIEGFENTKSITDNKTINEETKTDLPIEPVKESIKPKVEETKITDTQTSDNIKELIKLIELAIKERTELIIEIENIKARTDINPEEKEILLDNTNEKLNSTIAIEEESKQSLENLNKKSNQSNDSNDKRGWSK